MDYPIILATGNAGMLVEIAMGIFGLIAFRRSKLWAAIELAVSPPSLLATGSAVRFAGR
ncbi:hypothetical protein [Bradyrhizobium sp. Ai1a-2]|uniref:hypothetical protein n=1 Tax=Bradyrhizobium sp. Ai1a-2 TaxID=196490 RepID=UPI001363AD15|nr:hypothetical protein [Bradyrhizobium sp. Ai1a-2]